MKMLIALIVAALPAVANAEPFNASVISRGALADKWTAASKTIRSDISELEKCRAEEASCSKASLRIISIADSVKNHRGITRLGLVNRSVNSMIKYVEDVLDEWSGPLSTMSEMKGDCEDYAIAKMAALAISGVDFSDMRIVIFRDLRSMQDHAVLSVRLDGRWLILDNKTLAILEDRDVKPVIVFAAFGINPVSKGAVDETRVQ